MICTLPSMETPYQFSFPPQSDARPASHAESVSTPAWPVFQDRFTQRVGRSDPVYDLLHTPLERPRVDPCWQPTYSQSRWASEVDHSPNPSSSWLNEMHRRRPSSSAGVLTSDEWHGSPISPIEQYTPSSMYTAPRQARSSSQPGRLSGISQHNERPSLLRQVTEASPIQQQIWNESAFRGDADYQLFVEATFGLSPDQARNPSSASADYFDQIPLSRGFDEETLRSTTAFRQMAQLPMTPDESMAFREVSYHQPVPYHEVVAYQRFDDYTRARRRSQSFTLSPRDDELPNYAQSQAEMEQRGRREAVRRAQELQRRWRESQ